jgi:diadenosine tetraphosphate (Ap4A) HIT family hydrolase
MECPFCNIKERVIEEKDFCNVIFSNPRLMPGHILVTPKRHVEKLSELSNEEKLEIINTVTEYAEKTLKFSDGYTLQNNFMPFLPQSRTKVDHLHIHIWPRKNKDELYEKMLIHQHEVFHDLPEKDIEKYIKLLNS